MFVVVVLSNVILIHRWLPVGVPAKYLITTRWEYASCNVIPCAVATPLTVFLTPGRVLVIEFHVCILLSGIEVYPVYLECSLHVSGSKSTVTL